MLLNLLLNMSLRRTPNVTLVVIMTMRWNPEVRVRRRELRRREEDQF